MCMTILAYGVVPGKIVVLINNREEYFDRGTSSLHVWPSPFQTIVGGRDEERGGTWLCVSTDGKRFANLTNIRTVKPVRSKLSRGKVVSSFLLPPSLSPKQYLLNIQKERENYAGFNVIVGDISNDSEEGGIWYYTTGRDDPPVKLQIGKVYNLSNEFLDCNWPKCTAAAEWVNKNKKELTLEKMFAMMASTSKVSADDPLLPVTGLPVEFEVAMSSRFVTYNEYGTRTTSILTIADKNNNNNNNDTDDASNSSNDNKYETVLTERTYDIDQQKRTNYFQMQYSVFL